MRKLSFSIGSMLAVIGVLAIGLAALREASDLWDSATFSLTLGVLLAGVLLAVHRLGPARAFWVGFTVCGGAWLVLSAVPSIEPRLITTKALLYLNSLVPGRVPQAFLVRLTGMGTGATGSQIQTVAFSAYKDQLAAAGQGNARLWNASTGKLLWTWSGTTENFVRIGHSLFSLLAGLLGGLLSRRLHARSATTNEQEISK
jgi:hypothetical protein